MADEVEETEGDGTLYLPSNKKLTYFVIDGSEQMFDDELLESSFRKAVTVIYYQVLKICCSGALNQYIGVVITNTNKSQNKSDQKNFYEWIPLSVPGKEEAFELKSFVEADNIKEMFVEKFGGHSTNIKLGQVFWTCRKSMQTCATSTRHHMIMYFTNNTNPFENDRQSFDKFKKLVDDFSCTSYRDRNRLTKIIKTPGEFHVAMMCAELKEVDRKVWEKITPNIFHGTTEELETQAYKKTFSQRAFSKLQVEIAPNVKFGVGVYMLANETRPPTKQILNAETEQAVKTRVAYVPVEEAERGEFEEDEEETVITDRTQLKKAVTIGGQTIVNDEISFLDAKGITILGFKHKNDVDLTSHIQHPQFLYPDDDDIRGSTGIYRALWQRCYERDMIIIIRFCSRSNQKVRLAALVPQKKMTDEEIHLKAKDLYSDEKYALLEDFRVANEFRHNGFVVVFLPYIEDLRDVTEHMKFPQGGDWPKTLKKDLEVTDDIVDGFTKSYTPENYSNPRLRSFNAMLIEAAVGHKMQRIDTIAPFKNVDPQTLDNLKTKVADYFEDMDNQPRHKRGHATNDVSPGKKKKLDLSSMTTLEIAEQGLLDKLTVVQLNAALADVGKHPVHGKRKNELIQAVKDHYGCK